MYLWAQEESETHVTLSAELTLYKFGASFSCVQEAQRQYAHRQNEKHKTSNSPCTHKGVSNTTDRTTWLL